MSTAFALVLLLYAALDRAQNMTATISWNLFASYYEGLLWYGTGILTAAEPWSGYYDNENVGLVWASAHTTHFAWPGWYAGDVLCFALLVMLMWHRMYLQQGQGSGSLHNGGSYVTLTNGSDFSIVIEKMAWAHSQWFVLHAWVPC